MVINSHKATAIVFVVALTITLGGCFSSGGSGSNNTGGNDPGEDVNADDGLDLSEVSIAETTELAPFRGVAIDGLPDDASAEDLHVHYRLQGEPAFLGAGSEEASLAPVANFLGGPVEFLVPLVKADGANIEMRVTDGVNESSLITVSIAALPERQPGAWDDYIAGLRELVQTTAEEYGFTYPDDVQTRLSTPSITEVPYVPLVLAHYALEEDDNQFGLGSAEFEDEDLKLLERIIPHMTLIQDLDRYTDFARSDKALIQESLNEVDMQALPTMGDLESEAASVQVNAQLQQQGFSPQSWNDLVTFEGGTALIDGAGLFDVSGPDDVQDWMSRYDSAWRAQRTADAAIKTADYALTAATLAAIVSTGGSATPGAVASRAASRAALKRVIYAAEATAGVSRLGLGFIPCCLHEINTEFQPESGVGENEDGEGEIVRIDGVTAQMQNDGTDFGKELLERFVISELGDNVSGAVAKQASETLSGEIIRDAGFREVFGQFDVDLFDVRFVWENIDITGLNAQEKIEWEKFAASGGDPTFKLLTPFTNLKHIPFQYDSDAFFGRESDPTEVEMRPNEAFYTFGPWHPAIPEDRSEMRGVAIQVAFDPARLQVDDPGEVIEFSVEVRNADDTSLVNEGELATSPDLTDAANQDRLGKIEGPLPSSDAEQGVYDYEYHAPDDLTDFETIVAETESDSEQGVRERAADPDRRRGSMFIRTDGVEVAVSPRRVCLDEGESKTFEATDALTGEQVDVTWTADHGSISPNGTFISPGAVNAGGEMTSEVTASLVSDPDVTATAVVTMECSCWYDATVGGDIGQSYGAMNMWINFHEGSEAIESIQLSSDLEDDAPAGVELEFEQPVPAGATGTFDARIPDGTFRTSIGFGDLDPIDNSIPGTWINVPYEEEGVWGPASLADNAVYPLSDTNVPPIQVTFDRHSMWDEAPDDSDLRGGERSLALTVSGNVRRLGVDPINDDEAQVVIRESGTINIDVDGKFWPGLIDLGVPDDRHTCSPVL